MAKLPSVAPINLSVLLPPPLSTPSLPTLKSPPNPHQVSQGAETSSNFRLGIRRSLAEFGAVECPGCKGTGKNKKNGNIFEQWKCFECQGFGLKGCPNCGKGGLTPEQRGER